MTIITAEGSSRAIRAAPRPMQAAVSRPQGSPMIRSAGKAGNCLAVSSRYGSPVMTQERSGGTAASIRSSAI